MHVVHGLCAGGGGGEVLWYTCNLIAVVLFDTPHSLRYHAGLDLEWFNVALMRMRCIGHLMAVQGGNSIIYDD